MCDFLSFNFVHGAATVEDAVYAAPAMRSHSGAEAHWHLNPSSYVECEWLGDDDGDTLTVRDGNGDTRMTRRAILAAYPTRRALIDRLAAQLCIGWDHEREVPVLPTDYHVDGSLNLGGCTGLTSLPDGLSVGGSLNLGYCTGLTSLPDGLSVGGSLNLRGCTGLLSLPDGLSVGGSLDLGGCTGLTSLPDGLSVGGNIYR